MQMAIRYMKQRNSMCNSHRSANQNHNELTLIPVRMVALNDEERKQLGYHWWERELVRLLWDTV